MPTATIAESLRAATDLSVDGVGDDLCELAERIRAAAQPTLRAISRYVTSTVQGHDDWGACNLAAHVGCTLEDAVSRCIRATQPAEALAQAIRCAEAMASLGDDEAAEVATLIREFGAEMRAAREPEVVIGNLAAGLPADFERREWALPGV